MKNHALFAAVSLAAILTDTPLRAQSVNSGPRTRDSGAATLSPLDIGEVTVTATRRETKLQETPIPITVLSGTTIENTHVVSLQDVALTVPNMTFTKFSSQETYFSIRGTLINNNAAGWDDAVSTFIDDVPMTGVGDNDPNLFGLASIEVLRGPQGTVFGRNTTGGAVIIHTLAPSFTRGGKVETTYGRDNLVELRGMGTGPIAGDVLAGKISVDFLRHDDNITNTTLGGKTGGILQGDVRGQVLWQATPDADVLFGADYLIDRSGGTGILLLGNFQPSLYHPLSYGPDATNQGYNGRNDRDIGGLSARLRWTNSLGELTAVTGYRYVDDYNPLDQLGDPGNQYRAIGIVQDRQLSQEIRLASPSDRRLTWVAGVFGLHVNKFQGNPLNFNFSPNGALQGLAFTQQQDQRITVNSFAAFGDATLGLTDTMKLTVGGRETYEHKSGTSIVSYNPPIGGPPGDATYGHGWNSFTPKATLSYQPSHQLLLYATTAKGFKSGGYDLSGAGGANAYEVNKLLATPFNPETVWSYELGEKFTAPGDRASINVDVFQADYRNLQTSQLVFIGPDTISVTTNVPAARVRGVEAESLAAMTHWLTLGVTYAYMDAQFTDYPGLAGAPSLTGNRIPYAPRHQVHLSEDMHFPVARTGGTISLAADYTYHSKVFFDNANDSLPTKQFLYDASEWKDIVNLYLKYSSRNDVWKLSLWAKNVTNDRPVVHASPDVTMFEINPSLDNPTANQGLFVVKRFPRRSMGITVTRSF